MAELLHQAAPPLCPQAIADFVDTGAAPPATALDQTGMPAVLTRQKREDDVALAVAPRRQDECLVTPFHAPCPLSSVVIEPHRPVAFRVLLPIFAHLDMQE